MREWDTPSDVRAWHLGGGWDRRTALVALLVVLAALAAGALAVMAGDARISQGMQVPPLAPVARPASAAPLPVPTTASAPATISAAPQAAAVYACAARFPGGGAHATGPWIMLDGTLDLSAKPTVDGAVTWPSHFTVSLDGTTRRFTGNGLPSHNTGIFPIRSTDDAYEFDRNPNAIREAPLTLTVPALPAEAAQPGCLPMGPIGVLRTGAVLFNALDAAGRDAVAYEIQDSCFGHPAPMGAYHYHSLSPCALGLLGGPDDPAAHSSLIGYALDGFGIYGARGEAGADLATANLDACHGHTHTVEWDGRQVEIYHYHATWTYPYTLGCFKGTPAAAPR